MNTVQLQMYFGKRSLGMMEDGHIWFAVTGCEQKPKRRNRFRRDGLHHILSQSLDMFEEKKILDDIIDITNMFESGGLSSLMGRRFPAETEGHY